MHKSLFALLVALTVPLFAFEPVIVLLGPPGTGKGTFSQHLKEHYGYHHVSAGDIVRQEISERTLIGIEIEEIVKRGDFIPMPIMHALISSVITHLASNNKPFIIDGFVRSEEDAAFLHQLLSKLNLLDTTIGIMLEADDSICQERISHRQICSDCGHVYNTQHAPAQKVNSCDACQAPLIQRINDTPAIIDKRIRQYREQIAEIQTHSLEIHPHFTFFTDLPLDECLKKYSQLAEQAAQFDGKADSFIEKHSYRDPTVQPLIVGIAGGSGSGKSTLVRELKESLGVDATILYLDNYYIDLSHLCEKELQAFDFAEAASLEISLLQEHITALKKGKSISQPIYDYTTGARAAGTIRTYPAPIILIDGFIICALPELRDLCDLLLFVLADDAERLFRVLERDQIERGRSFQQIKQRYIDSVQPSYQKTIHDSQYQADLIIPNNRKNPKSLKLILSAIQSFAQI